MIHMFLSIFSLPILSAFSKTSLNSFSKTFTESFAVSYKLALYLEWTVFHAIISLLGISKDGKSILLAKRRTLTIFFATIDSAFMLI